MLFPVLAYVLYEKGALIDSYATANNDVAALYGGAYLWGHDCTLGSTERPFSASIEVGKVGSPTGNFRFELRLASDKSLVAYTDWIPKTELGALTLVEINFSTTGYLSADDYILCANAESLGDASNYMTVGTNNAGSDPGQSYTYDGATWSTSTKDMRFYLYGTA